MSRPRIPFSGAALAGGLVPPQASAIPQLEAPHVCRPARPRDLRPASIRRACRLDIPQLLDLHRESLHKLGGLYYTPRQIDALLTRVGTVDPDIIEDGTYLVAEVGERIVGCGGWTLRTPGYESLLDRETARKPAGPRVWAHIRGVFVSPDFARRGIAKRIVTLAEEAAVLRGQAEGIELLATLSGIPLYFRLGYRAVGPVSLPLGDSEVFFGMHMAKIVLDARPDATAVA
jgi:GNAT superfamily N-acetyltransferase